MMNITFAGDSDITGVVLGSLFGLLGTVVIFTIVILAIKRTGQVKMKRKIIT